VVDGDPAYEFLRFLESQCTLLRVDTDSGATRSRSAEVTSEVARSQFRTGVVWRQCRARLNQMIPSTFYGIRSGSFTSIMVGTGESPAANVDGDQRSTARRTRHSVVSNWEIAMGLSSSEVALHARGVSS